MASTRLARATDGAAPKMPAKLFGVKIVLRTEKGDTNRPPSKNLIKIIFDKTDSP